MVSDPKLKQTIDALISEEALPDTYADTVEQTILPLVEHILNKQRRIGKTVLVGIHGAQGTGKSTLTLFLQEILGKHFQCPTASFSLDDIYLTRAERAELAQRIHPLFQTRGVPGTHDMELGRRVIADLRKAQAGDQTPIPVFDKSIDDRVPEALWPSFQGAASVILLEGWCVGGRPELEVALAQPINELERTEDAEGIWRRTVNESLKGSYRHLFEDMDSLVMLKAPSMDSVQEWRTLQEHKLADKVKSAPKKSDGSALAPSLRIMSDAEVHRFIMHYERVTRACLGEMPARADVLIEVAEDHSLGLPRFKTK